MDDVAAEVDGEVAADGAGGRLGRVRLAQKLAASQNRAAALPHLWAGREKKEGSRGTDRVKRNRSGAVTGPGLSMRRCLRLRSHLIPSAAASGTAASQALHKGASRDR